MRDADHRGGETRRARPEHGKTSDSVEEAGSALEHVPELSRLLIQSVRDYAIFVLDPEGYIVTWNPGAERINGYTAEEIIGRHFSVFYPEEDLAWDKPGMELRVAGAEGRFEDEGWRIRKGGTRFWSNVVITALRDEEGELVGFAKVTRDLTERRKAEERAIEDARRVAEAEAANRAKSEFLAAMSHELRTPLNAIAGYVDLLSMGIRGPVTPEQLADLNRIRQSQQHLLGIINDLLNFSRIEAGRLVYDLKQVSLRELAASVRPLIDPQVEPRGLTVEWPAAGPDVTVHADETKAQQILVNLLTNALKFTESGGRIIVSLGTEGERGTIAVADTGVGISEDGLKAIFEPFVQVGRSLSSPHEGTGLGLAISRELARGMGGDLTVSSTPGVGSTFTLLLPLEAPSESD